MNLIMLSAIPLFVVGLLEDVKKGEGTQPLTRLFVAAVCSLIAISIFGISIEQLDIPMIDPIFQVSIFAILFTMFASAGLTHAMNLIDGVNGLSAFITLSAMVSLGIVAARYGHNDLLMRSFMIFSGKKLPLARANPLGSVAIWPFVVLTCTLGIVLLTEKQLAIFATVFLASIFVVSYLTICQWTKTRNMPHFGLYLFGNSSDPQTDP